MKVLAVSLLFPPLQLGGYEIVCEGVARAAGPGYHHTKSLASDYGVANDRATNADEPSGLTVRRTLRSYLDAAAQRTVALTPRQRLELERANAAVLDRTLHEFQPDVVSWWGMGGMSLSLIERVRRRGLPAVLMVQDPWPSYGFQADGWTRMTRRLQAPAPLIERLTGIPVRYRLELAGRYIFNSEHTRAVSAAAGIVPGDSAVVTPGIHARYLTSAEEHPWEWRLLQVGRIDPDKGVDISIDALAQLPPQAILTVIGAGESSYLERLHRQAESLGVSSRVRFLGRVDAARLPAHYAEADAVLFPIRWEEPWGLVPLEAMGVGRPVLATPRGGALTYLRDEQNSLFIPVDDPSALAGAVRRLAESPELRGTLRLGGLRTAAEHTAERHDARMVDELELAAAGGTDKLRR
jgi:glycogen synthase